jgi:pyruvate dehydrogenase E2 component (dihydrolipoamide acetyltransferase)
MRKTIAARLTESKSTIPHYYISADITMDETLKIR